MNSTRRAVERLKTALIVILLASAVLLGWRTGLFNDFFSSFNLFGDAAEFIKGSSGSETGGLIAREATRPLCIVITNADGGHFGVKYDVETRNSIYSRTCGIFGDALGSASDFTEISEVEWREVLSGSGVYYEYAEPVKLSLLSAWIQPQIANFAWDSVFCRVCVAFGEDKNRIYYQDSDSGLFFGADTASAAGKTHELEMFGANNAQYAFETGIKAAANAPYLLIMPGSDYSDVAAAASGSSEELLATALAAFGHNSETYTKPFFDSGGTLVCIGTQFTMSIDAAGGLAYRRSDMQPTAGAGQRLSESETVEKARALVAETIGAVAGGAEVFYKSLDYSGDGACNVVFGYYIAGGQVLLRDDRYAAKITFRHGVVTEAEMNFRSFAIAGGSTVLMFEKQTLAAAGGDFSLTYSDTGSGSGILKPYWMPRDD
ncbi:MAG: hypothetical protein LBH28_07580 [Oscillospiraceae bacterium]|jgi:hypothetical protein|nr:hypothetical protein [Oscillospiraceae bacterium]